MRNKNNQIDLNELALGCLPERILSSIDQLTITMEELDRWESSKPAIRIVVSESILKLDIHIWIPLKVKKSTAAIFGLATAIIYTGARFVINNWSDIHALINLK
jgi:hypothetical protein